MSLHEPAATRPRSTTTLIGSAVGDLAAPRAHERASVEDLFERYEALVDSDGSDDAKHRLAQRICALLAARERGAVDGFEPVELDASDERSRLDDGECRVATAQELIERIRAMEADDARTSRRTRGLDGG